jgi:hypothetical protein
MSILKNKKFIITFLASSILEDIIFGGALISYILK